jgi:hypothetical protein
MLKFATELLTWSSTYIPMLPTLAHPTPAAAPVATFFLGSIPRDDSPIIINGAIHITCTILKLVAASAAEAELCTLFLNAQEAKVL